MYLADKQRIRQLLSIYLVLGKPMQFMMGFEPGFKMNVLCRRKSEFVRHFEKWSTIITAIGTR
jgi:hypothetical protein